MRHQVCKGLPDLTLDRLDKTLATYSAHVGQGFDCLPPRTVLLLPKATKVRLLDLLHAFEK